MISLSTTDGQPTTHTSHLADWKSKTGSLETQKTVQVSNFQILFEKLGKWLKLGKRKLGSRHLKKMPLFVLFVSLIQVIVYYAADDRAKRILLYDTENKMEVWRFLSYMLVHTDGVHLGLNVVIQGILGAPLEFEQGRLRCAAIYLGGGLAGSLGASVFAAFSFMAGASAGIYALLTSQIPNVVLNYGTVKCANYRIVTVAALTASDVIYIICHVYFHNNEKPQIGWVAHASGAAAGLLLGFLSFTGTSKWRKKFQVISGVMLALPTLWAVVVVLLPPSAFRGPPGPVRGPGGESRGRLRQRWLGRAKALAETRLINPGTLASIEGNLSNWKSLVASLTPRP